MIQIKPVPAKFTHVVRHPVLRPGKPIDTCIFEGDDLSSTKHFGLYFNEDLIGVISVFENKSSIFNHPNQLQIRGMAVLEKFQGKGYGRLLVNEVENYAKKVKSNLIWFNARENAAKFYKILGYEIYGSLFDIAGIGLHYVMYKQI
ncbi:MULTISPECIES: GNAT family N-acetyltransferase [Flavobacterium]|uniref:GNAT family N-acetyltransferase n=1 Tax=Flavobacterium hankyongi TaxID=1176532 RepID=A0ABP8ZUQ1_9FLAO|nr:GNAT family N-acetyltransferase [Flavobacterium sp. N1846]